MIKKCLGSKAFPYCDYFTIFEDPERNPCPIFYGDFHPEGKPYYKEALNNCMCRINRIMAHECEINCNVFTEVYWYHPDYLGNTEYVSDIGGFIYQHFFYSPFGEALVSQHANSGRYDTEFRFNGKEQDPETGLYYYGARYYNPRYSIWMSVDPLASEFPSWTPYNYTKNNPINLIDPDGRAALPPEAGEFEDGFVWTDNDGSYTFDAESKTWTPNDENSLWTDWVGEVEATTTLSKHEKTMQNPVVQSVHKKQKDAVRGAAELGAHTLQQTGDATSLVGYGLTLTGVGAPLGIPMAAVGNGMSATGSAIDMIYKMEQGDIGGASKNASFMVAGDLAALGANRIPGSSLFKNVLKQNASLKVRGIERLTEQDF